MSPGAVALLTCKHKRLCTHTTTRRPLRSVRRSSHVTKYCISLGVGGILVLYMLGSVGAMRSTHIHYSGHNLKLLFTKLSGNVFFFSFPVAVQSCKGLLYTQNPSFVGGGGQLSWVVRC